MNLPRLFHTIKYLKLIQIRYQLKYRLYPLLKELNKFQKPLQKKVNGEPLKFKEYIEKPVSFNQNFTFEFLNQKITFEHNQINWEEGRFGKLWSYNLNYMDYLLQPGINKETGLQLIHSFIIGLLNNITGLEPYPTSLRGINWIKFISKFEIKDKVINETLYKQYKLLSRRLEFHLLGNHLLENALSLLFGAFYFSDKYFYAKATKILKDELDEQVLDDGGHYELSPMYHQIILDRLLDCINLLQNNKRFDKQEDLLLLMRKKAELMLKWLNNMTFSNGQVPLLNDAAPEIAPGSQQLNEYASSLQIKPATRNPQLSASGYRRFNGINYEAIIDIGQMGPLYQPGHAHADTFNFVLNVNNQPFIVDTGISTYEDNEIRLAERGTAAHNTVTVLNENSSEVWSSFRVARRGKVKVILDNENNIIARHDGYQRLGVIHQREWEFSKNGISIQDDLFGKRTEGKVHLWLAPGLTPVLHDNKIRINQVILTFENAIQTRIIQTKVPYGYNRFSENYKIEIAFKRYLNTFITVN